MRKTSTYFLERKDWQVVVTLLMAISVIVITHFFAIQELDKYEDSSVMVRASYQRDSLLRELEGNLVDMENSGQQLVLLEQDEFVGTTEKAIQQAAEQLAAVRNLFRESAEQQTVAQLERWAEEKIQFNKTRLRGYQQAGQFAADPMAGSDRSLVLWDSISTLTAAIRQQHHRQLDAFISQKNRTSTWLRFASWASVFLVFLLSFFSIYYLAKTARNRYAAEREKEQQQHELEQHLIFIKDLYDHAPIGYHSIDPEGLIIEINQTELDWLGYGREEVVGKMKISEVFLPEIRENEEQLFPDIGGTANEKGMRGKLKCKDGSLMQVLASSRAVIDKAGNFSFSRSATMDFTAYKKMEDALIQARELAEQSVQLKEQFIANMSHEIRTPLNAILGFSNLLQRSGLNNNQQEFAQGIRTSSENLLAVINDILDFSKIAAGAIRIEQIPFSLPALLQSVDQMFHYRADEKHLEFEVQAAKNVPEAVLGDPTRLTQILVNLLGNAFKFTEQGRVALSVTSTEQQAGTALIEFRVSDTGIGIAPEMRDVIFERFGQASADTTRRFGGAGLGLTISRQLAELQGGSIRVESAEGQGATFIVEIPYPIAEGAGAQSQNQLLDSRLKNGKVKILIVEDNPLNQRIAELLLDDWEFLHEHAANGKIALEMLRNNVYDLVLMDIQMPEMDGYTAAQAIRQTLGLQVPVIATTAHAFAGEREKCISYGMNDYISKPIKEKELLALIQRYVLPMEKKKHSYLISGNTKQDPAGFDRQYVLDISKGKPAVLKEMAGLFVSQSAKELEQLTKALQSNNFGDAAMAAHSMKSTAAYMGFAATLGERLKELELAARDKLPDATVLNALYNQVNQLRREVVDFLEKGL